MQCGLLVGDLLQDLRIGLRGLRRAPMMTMTIVATVGLGIGATTVIYSSRLIVPALRRRGYDVTFREFGGGHDVPAAIARESMVWLAETK